LLAFPSARADLGTAIHRSIAARGQVALPARSPLVEPVVLPLRRVVAEGSDASFYVGDVSVGYPAKTLSVVFDTASGNVILPHRACRDITCRERRRYSPWESLTATDVNEKGEAIDPEHRLARGNKTRDVVTVSFSQSDLGEGEVKAVFVRDSVCVGAGDQMGHACADMTVLAAVNMQERPFRRMPSDGVVGLGFGGLTVGPLCSFFSGLLGPGAAGLPQFGFALGADRGELHLGGHDPARLASDLRWFPVDHPDAGLWQVAVQAVRVGNVTVDDCRHGCHGVIDTAVARLGVQAGKFRALQSALTSAVADGKACAGPDLTFDLGGLALTLQAKDYTDGKCDPLLGRLDLEEPEYVGVYAFGTTLLRRYYTAFDSKQQKLGFATLVEDANRARAPMPEALGGTLLV